MTPAAGGYPLYCCHTMYHVLIALVRAMRQRQNGGAQPAGEYVPYLHAHHLHAQ